MDNGIYTALSGALKNQIELDTVSNNLANASTTGYKKNAVVFRETLAALGKKSPQPEGDETGKVAAPDENKMVRAPANAAAYTARDIKDGAYTAHAELAYPLADANHVDFSQGTLQPTQNKLNVALDGSGFFAIETADGVKYSRDGAFKINNTGMLVNKQGNPVLTTGLNPEKNAKLVPLKQVSKDIEILTDGTILQGGQPVAKLAVTEFTSQKLLQKVGNDLFSNDNLINKPLPYKAVQTAVHQGFLESSNVNPVSEMVKMIELNRNFAATQKVLQAYSDMNQKGSNNIGSF